MKLLNKITNLYLYFILVIFVLIVDSSGYTNILNFKWNIYVYISIIYILLMLIIILFKIFNKSIDIKKFRLSKIHFFVFIYLIIMIISTLLSPYKNYNLFVGSARMQGLIVNIIYVVTFIIVSITYKFDKKILYALLLPSIVMGIIIIIESIFKTNIVCGTDYCYGTIGNVDTVGLLYTMYLVMSIMLFIFSRFNKVFLGISIILSLLVMMIINTLGMYVTLFIMLVLILPYIILKSIYLIKYLLVILCIIAIVLLFNFNIFYLVILLFIMLIIIILIKNNYNVLNKKNVICIYSFMFITILLMILVLYLIDFKDGLLYEIHNILHGNLDDSFGTYRMYLWKNTVKMIDKKYILLGTGTDTYYIRFMNTYLAELIDRGYVSIYDNACNYYLTMIINIGILGLISFMLFMGSIINTIKRNKNIVSICLLFGIVSYLVQGIYNLEVVLVTPIFYILLSLYTSLLKSVEK